MVACVRAVIRVYWCWVTTPFFGQQLSLYCGKRRRLRLLTGERYKKKIISYLIDFRLLVFLLSEDQGIRWVSLRCCLVLPLVIL